MCKEVGRGEKSWQQLRELTRGEKSWDDLRRGWQKWKSLRRVEKSREEVKRVELRWEEMKKLESCREELREELRRAEMVWEEPELRRAEKWWPCCWKLPPSALRGFYLYYGILRVYMLMNNDDNDVKAQYRFQWESITIQWRQTLASSNTLYIWGNRCYHHTAGISWTIWVICTWRMVKTCGKWKQQRTAACSKAGMNTYPPICFQPSASKTRDSHGIKLQSKTMQKGDLPGAESFASGSF